MNETPDDQSSINDYLIFSSCSERIELDFLEFRVESQIDKSRNFLNDPAHANLIPQEGVDDKISLIGHIHSTPKKADQYVQLPDLNISPIRMPKTAEARQIALSPFPLPLNEHSLIADDLDSSIYPFTYCLTNNFEDITHPNLNNRRSFNSNDSLDSTPTVGQSMRFRISSSKVCSGPKNMNNLTLNPNINFHTRQPRILRFSYEDSSSDV